MTRSRRATASGGSDYAAAARDAFALATGTLGDRAHAVDWKATFTLAARESLAALCWSRSGDTIRHAAPSLVVDRWRALALAADIHGRVLLDEQTNVLAALEERGIHAIVLKGLPLSVRLYREPFVRCTSDVDLYIAADHRRAAAAVLDAAGWLHEQGDAPWHQSFERGRDGEAIHVECHSSLVNDHLAHLPVPAPTSSRVRIERRTCLAHDGPFLAAHLAAHLATHQLPPLLWFVDFATLWASYVSEERAAARAAAQAAGLERYLEWAAGLADAVHSAAAGDPRGLAALGVSAGGRSDTHSIWRHLRLAPGARAAAQVAWACAHPRPARGDVRRIAADAIRRVQLRARWLFGRSRAYRPLELLDGGAAARARPRPLTLDRADMLEIVRAAVEAGSGVWVRANGRSMLPTIPRGALVWLAPLPDRALRPGDVVLALTAEGDPVVHRVLRAHGDTVDLRGDNSFAADPPVPTHNVLAHATHVRTSDATIPMPTQRRQTLSVSMLRLRRRAAMIRHGAH